VGGWAAEAGPVCSPPASKEEAAAFPHADILVFSFFIFFILSAGFCCVPEVCPLLIVLLV